MLEMGCPPNEFVVATLFKLWAFCKNRDYARKKILSLYEFLLNSKIGLDAFAVKALLQAFRRIMPTSFALEEVDRLSNRMLDFGLAPESGCLIACLNFDKSSNAFEKGLGNTAFPPPRSCTAHLSPYERPPLSRHFGSVQQALAKRVFSNRQMRNLSSQTIAVRLSLQFTMNCTPAPS